jgi:hypothetical protein
MKPRHTVPRRAGSSRPRSRSSERSKEAPQTAPPVSANAFALQLFAPDPAAIYSLETTSHLAGVPRRTILIYCKHKLVSPAYEPATCGYWFTAETIYALRQIHDLHCSRCRDELQSLVTIMALVDQIRRLRAEMRGTTIRD